MRGVDKWINKLSHIFEFFIVILIAFGLFFVSALLSFLSNPPKVVITENRLIFLLIYESIVLLVLGWFLKKRGWTLKQLGAIPDWKSTILGVGLIPCFYVLYVIIWIALFFLFPELHQINSQSKILTASSISIWKIVLVSILNPLFEEIFVCGYVISFLKKSKDGLFAVTISTAIRTFYHIYQPFQGIIAVITIGFIFGVFYAKTNRLWSAIVAHAILDLWGLLKLSSR